LHAGAARLTSGAHDEQVSTFKMNLKLLRADDLMEGSTYEWNRKLG
jgi:hypothetical protein